MGDTPNGGTEPSALELYAETLAELLNPGSEARATDQEVIERAKREAADSIRDFLVAADQARQAERCRAIAVELSSRKSGSREREAYKRTEDLYVERREAALQRQEELNTPAVQATLDTLRALDVMEQQVSQGDT